MKRRYNKHYTLEEARALLTQVGNWLERLAELRAKLEKCDEKLGKMIEPGRDTGGPLVNEWVRMMADIKDVLLEFHRREIQVKDLDRGLVDFPAIIGGKEVFLCWEQGEEDIEFWHELDAGYAGRERL